MDKISVKVYFEAEATDGSKRNYSRTVKYINSEASNEDLRAFPKAFGLLLGTEIKRSEKITVTAL